MNHQTTDTGQSRGEVDAARAVSGSMVLLAGIVLLLGLAFAGSGLISDYAQSRDAFQYCEGRVTDVPVDVVSSGESSSSGQGRSSWPLGVVCDYRRTDGSTFHLQPGWALTWQTYGGLTLVAFSVLTLCGAAITEATLTIRSTRVP